MAELEAGLKGLAVWFEALPSRSPDGQHWGSNNYLADTISKTRNMLQAREPNWQGIAANVEWLGEELSKRDRAQSLFQRARYEFKYVD